MLSIAISRAAEVERENFLLGFLFVKISKRYGRLVNYSHRILLEISAERQFFLATKFPVTPAPKQILPVKFCGRGHRVPANMRSISTQAFGRGLPCNTKHYFINSALFRTIL